MIVYQPWTNGNVENLNGILGDMLTKYVTDKPMKFWDEYLLQALFATRIQAYSILKYRPYYLLYDQHSYLSSDNTLFQSLEVAAIIIAKHKKKIANLRNSQSIANKALLEKAIKVKKICKKRVEKVDHEPIPIG